jgi:hypothetical protein
MCFLAGLLGIAFHIFAVKLPATKTRAQVANMAFTYTAFFQDELAAILSSLLAVIAALVALDELVAYKPDVLPYIKVGFIFIGFTGSSVLIALLGKASSKINAVVDIKTNISDQVAPDVPPDQKV